MKFKYIFLILILSLILVGCSELDSSLREPVDPENKTLVSVTIEEGSSWNEVAQKLSELKLIASKGALIDIVKEKGYNDRLYAGTAELSQSMNLEQILEILVGEGRTKNSVTITIPEGYEFNEIAKILEEKNVITKDKLLEGIKNFDTSKYDFLKGIDKKYNFEGFLYPDTYDFFENSSADDVLEKFLDRFNEIFNEEYKAQLKKSGYDMNQIITMASIIEREGRLPEELPIMASVFYNRLKTDMPLGSCATVQFILQERKQYLSIEDTQINSPYNTYINVGLPPAPIASPGEGAIKAALFPAKTDYLFFVLEDEDTGKHKFSKTYEEHEMNIQNSNAIPE